MAHMQSRVGPMYAGGFHGWAQLVADGVKFVAEGGHHPGRRRPHGLQARAGGRAGALPRRDARDPAGPTAGRGRTSTPALFFVLAVMGVGVLGTLMAGLVERQQVLPARRPARRRPAAGYELPIVLAAASVAMAAGTLSLTGIVAAWSRGGCSGSCRARSCSSSPALAELQRPPFDMPVADAEIVFGPYTEYTGLRFAFFLLAEYAGIVVLVAADRRAVPRRLARARSPTSSAGCGRCSRRSLSRSS